jgi:ATP-dependent DNA helicase RecG
MAFEHKRIDASEVARILKFDEGHYLDVKRIDVRPGKLTETVSAFANTAGGELFVGIGEEQAKEGHFWESFTNFEAANSHIQAIEGMSPLGNHYRAAFLSSEGQQGYVLHILVFKTRDIIKASNGHAYVRRNAQNQRVLGEDGLHRLRLDKGVVSFEDET